MRDKVTTIGCVIVGVSTKITILSQDLGTQVTRKHNESIESDKNWLRYASNQGTQSMSVTNAAILLAIVAMPIDSAYSIHDAGHDAGHILSARAHH